MTKPCLFVAFQIQLESLKKERTCHSSQYFVSWANHLYYDFPTDFSFDFVWISLPKTAHCYAFLCYMEDYLSTFYFLPLEVFMNHNQVASQLSFFFFLIINETNCTHQICLVYPTVVFIINQTYELSRVLTVFGKYLCVVSSTAKTEFQMVTLCFMTSYQYQISMAAVETVPWNVCQCVCQMFSFTLFLLILEFHCIMS